MARRGFFLLGRINSKSDIFGPQYRRHRDICEYVKKILPNRKARILDVGCGAGRIASILKEGGYVTIDGVDVLPEEKVTGAIDHYWRINLDAGEWGSNLGRKYDLIICSDVLEHLENPASTLRQMSNLLIDTGEILISIPNAFNVMERCRILLTGNSGRYAVEKRGECGHIAMFTDNIMTSLLERADLGIVEKIGGAMFFFGFSWFPGRTVSPLLSYYVIYRIKKK